MCGSPEYSKQGFSGAAPHVGQGTETISSGVSSFSFIAKRYGYLVRENCSILHTFGGGYFGRTTSWIRRFLPRRGTPSGIALRFGNVRRADSSTISPLPPQNYPRLTMRLARRSLLIST